MSSAIAATESTDVILRDGSTLRLRAPAVEDAEALAQFFSGLSEQSRYLRFHGFSALGPSLVEPVLEPDWRDRGALVGSLGGRIVAVANWVRLRNPRAAEVAFAVGDDFQGHGIGTRLLEQLAARAAQAGIEEFVAEVLQENAAMLGVFRAAGFTITRSADGGEVEIRLAIAPTATTASTLPRATTSRCGPRSSPSSSRAQWQSSEHRSGAARSAASCSATSSPAASPARPIPSIATRTLSEPSTATAQSTRFPR